MHKSGQNRIGRHVKFIAASETERGSPARQRLPHLRNFYFQARADSLCLVHSSLQKCLKGSISSFIALLHITAPVLLS